MLSLILAASLVMPNQSKATHEPLASPTCNELDLRINKGADVKSVEQMRQDFERFIADSKRKCALKGG